MNQLNTHEDLIKKIRRRRKIVSILTVIALLLTIVLCSPMYMEFVGETIVDYKGINPVITILLILFILLCGFFAYVGVLWPMTTSLDLECDPQKHLILNSSLNKQKNMDDIYAADLFYLGSFNASLDYANKMVADKSPQKKSFGLFYKARCEFFIGDFEALKLTVKQFEACAPDAKNAKQVATYEKIFKILNLLVAMADDDRERISEHRNIECWNNSKAVQGFVSYLKGVAAYRLDDKQEAVYRLKFVRENCPKIIFSEMAEEYLDRLK